jgi:hypothetical protein
MSTFSVFFPFHVHLASLLYLSRRFGVSRSACWNVMELKNTRFFLIPWNHVKGTCISSNTTTTR